MVYCNEPLGYSEEVRGGLQWVCPWAEWETHREKSCWKESKRADYTAHKSPSPERICYSLQHHCVYIILSGPFGKSCVLYFGVKWEKLPCSPRTSQKLTGGIISKKENHCKNCLFAVRKWLLLCVKLREFYLRFNLSKFKVKENICGTSKNRRKKTLWSSSAPELNSKE